MDVACRFCRKVEPNDHLLATNHGPALGGVCTSMYLRRNHVIGLSRQSREWRAERLGEYIDRAEEVWRYTDTSWLEPYRAMTSPLQLPDHAAVPDSEELALL